MEPPGLRTDRLRLRQWRPEDVDALHAVSGDPAVMRYFLRPSTREETAALVERHRDNLARSRPGLFAVERTADGAFLGFVGLAVPSFPAPFMPCVEIGWRLAPHAWGQGYATEAAAAALRHGFLTLGLVEVVSFTAVVNEPSVAVMRRLGMHRDPAEDFDHPRVPEGNPLRRHVLYRLTASRWRETLGRGGRGRPDDPDGRSLDGPRVDG